MVVRACLQGCPPRSAPGPRAPSPGRRPQLEVILSGPPGQGPPPPLNVGAEGARLEVPPVQRPSGARPRKVCPFEPDGRPIERTGEYPKSSYPAHHGRGPPLDAGADGAWLEVPPVESPPGPRPRKVPPQTWPTAPNSKSSYPAPHGRAPPPPSMLGRRGHASNYPPSKALPPPGPARRAPSTPPPGPRRARRPSHRANWRVPTIPKMPTVPRAKPPGPPRRRHAPSKVLSAGPHGL